MCIPEKSVAIDMHPNAKICLVRHGETAWNVERRLQGHIDVPLNSTGQAQAEATARRLSEFSFAAIYTSDLLRARQTAQTCALHHRLSPVPLSSLRERHFGVLQGLTYDEARSRHPDAYQRFEERDPDYAFEGGGESLRQFSARIGYMIGELAERHLGQQILLVAHGGVLDVVNRMVRKVSLQAQRDFLIPNAALNWISFSAGCWQILGWAEQGHLEASRDELPNH